MEHKIVAAIAADRTAFDRVDQHLTQEMISPEGVHVLKAIRDFYYRDAGAMSVDLDLIKKVVYRGLTNPKHKDVIDVYFGRLSTADISPINVISEVLEQKREATELRLADAILSKDKTRVPELIAELSALTTLSELDADHEEYQELDADSLISSFSAENRIVVGPMSLNTQLGGGVLRGHHIVVVALPETGKTLVVINMMAGFVHQKLKCLYIGNEDPIKSIILRFITSLTELTMDEVLRDPQAAVALARRRGYANVVFAGLPGGTIEDIRGLIVKHKPDVLIVDQIRNVTVSKSENRTQQLEQVARAMRNFGREFDLLSVSITQGADSARNKLILDMGDVDGSNVGIPGTADVMLMLGMNRDFELNNNRQLTLAKNKVSGSHASWPVKVVPTLSRIEDF